MCLRILLFITSLHSAFNYVLFHNAVLWRVLHTLSGCIGKVVASHAAVARSSPAEVALTLPLPLFMLCTWRSGDTAHEGGGATRQLDLQSVTPCP